MRRTLAVIVSVLLVVVTYAGLDAFDKVPGILTRDRPGNGAPSVGPQPAATSDGGLGTGDPTPGRTLGPAPGGSPGATAGPGAAVRLPVVDAAAAPLPIAGAAADPPTSAGLLKALTGALRDRRLGPSVGVTVRDAATGAHLLDSSASVPRTPASTTKLLTAAAVMSVLDPDSTVPTSVVRGAGNTVYLVAGGDTLLATGRGSSSAVAGRAGLGDLAAAAAPSLKAAGVLGVTLRLDDSAVSGPRYAPGWTSSDIGYGLTGPVAMLGLAAQRPRAGRAPPADPAMSAAATFATALRGAGIAVLGATKRAAAPTGAAEVAVVRSAPVADVLALALAESDNALTESLARRAAASARVGPSFAAVAGWVRAAVQALGIDVAGVRLVDTSGLSRGTVIPARVVGDVLARAAGGQDPPLQRVIAELPVAGLDGTLSDRFRTGSSRTAAGIARAKTGTLTGTSSLAGTVVDREGRLLLFAILADRVPAATGTTGARAALDRFVATLAACGCR